MAKIYLQTMGCDKNTADSSSLRALLEARGHAITEDIEEADWALLNTCGFILPAKEESIQELLWMVEEKKKRPNLRILALGCLVEKYREELLEALPEVDDFFGVYGLSEIAEYIGGQSTKKPSLRSEHTATAYVKIADGCDTRCTYCAIPSIKGPYISRRPEEIIEEARQLASQGVKEIILVAQDTTAYGCDLEEEINLVSLLEELVCLEAFHWIRILYAYPDHVTEELITCMHRHPSICNYLDMPLQHADDSILRKMGRQHTRKDIEDTIDMIRRIEPEMVFRSTFIAGFPQEDQEAFAVLLKFLGKIKMMWVGAFIYSKEDQTPAANMSGQIKEEIKQARYEKLMLTQQYITKKLLGAYIGRSLEVLVEEKIAAKQYVGRSSFMTKDVDGVVVFAPKQDDPELEIGSFVDVHIIEATEYDLIGELR